MIVAFFLPLNAAAHDQKLECLPISFVYLVKRGEEQRPNCISQENPCCVGHSEKKEDIKIEILLSTQEGNSAIK